MVYSRLQVCESRWYYSFSLCCWASGRTGCKCWLLHTVDYHCYYVEHFAFEQFSTAASSDALFVSETIRRDRLTVEGNLSGKAAVRLGVMAQYARVFLNVFVCDKREHSQPQGSLTRWSVRLTHGVPLFQAQNKQEMFSTPTSLWRITVVFFRF